MFFINQTTLPRKSTAPVVAKFLIIFFLPNSALGWRFCVTTLAKPPWNAPAPMVANLTVYSSIFLAVPLLEVMHNYLTQMTTESPLPSWWPTKQSCSFSPGVFLLLFCLTTWPNLPKTPLCLHVGLLTNHIPLFPGVPLLVVLCNHIAQTTTDSPLPSWWLTHGSMVYYTCTAYTIFLLSTFVFLFYLVSKRLKGLTVVKGSDSKKAILRRWVI